LDDNSTNAFHNTGTSSDSNTLQVYLDGSAVSGASRTLGGEDLGWFEISNLGTSISSGSHTIRVELEESGDVNSEVDVDISAVYDNRFTYTFDNTVNTTQGYLDGPELYPDLNKIDANESISLDNPFDTARLNTSWDDTSNSQLIGVSADGNSYQEFSNTEDQTVTFGSDTNSAYARFGISRYSPNGARSQTPRFGYETQAVALFTLTSVGENIRPNEIGELRVQAQLLGNTAVGETFAEAGLKASDGTLLTRSLVPEFTKQSGQQVFSSEILRWQNVDSV
jgi:hypothetical protein